MLQMTDVNFYKLNNSFCTQHLLAAILRCGMGVNVRILFLKRFFGQQSLHMILLKVPTKE